MRWAKPIIKSPISTRTGCSRDCPRLSLATTLRSNRDARSRWQDVFLTISTGQRRINATSQSSRDTPPEPNIRPRETICDPHTNRFTLAARTKRYLSSALFTNVSPQTPVVCDEIFGPIAAVLRVPDYDAALNTANDGEFGLSAGIVTWDAAKSTISNKTLKQA